MERPLQVPTQSGNSRGPGNSGTQFLSECLIFKLWPAYTSVTSTERGLNSLEMQIHIPSVTLLLWLSWLSEMTHELSLTVSSITLITVFFLSKPCCVFHIDSGREPKLLGKWIQVNHLYGSCCVFQKLSNFNKEIVILFFYFNLLPLIHHVPVNDAEGLLNVPSRPFSPHVFVV